MFIRVMIWNINKPPLRPKIKNKIHKTFLKEARFKEPIMNKVGNGWTSKSIVTIRQWTTQHLVLEKLCGKQAQPWLEVMQLQSVRAGAG